MMKALTILQPYAALIVNGKKPVENRTWRTSFRGRFAIHAGIQSHPSSKYPLTDTRGCEIRGAFVGLATIADCVEVTGSGEIMLSEKRCKYSELIGNPHVIGPWCLILKDIVKLKQPVPWRGFMGFWDFQSILIPESMTA